MDEQKCNQIIELYLLNKSPIYFTRYIIGLLVAIFVYIYVTNKKMYNNPFINQILIPIGVFLLIVILIEVLVRNSLSRDEKQRLKMLCKLWLNDPNTKNDPNNFDVYGLPVLRMDIIENYTGKIEGFTDYGEEEENIDLNKLSSSINCNIENEDTNKTEYINNKQLENNQINNSTQIYSVTPIGDSLFNKKTPLSENAATIELLERNQNKCLLGDNKCGALCSGFTSNPCNLVAPIPGPQWQPQSASTVQERIMKGDFVPSRCPQGGQALRTAPDCKNIPLDASQEPTNVQCVTIPTRNQ